MNEECSNLKVNNTRCTCTYPGCDKHGKCCECLHYHLALKQLPGCCFTPNAEKTYDRSFRKFIEVMSGKK